jgi:hypothetical protein
LHQCHVAGAKVPSEYPVRFRPRSGLVGDRELEEIVEAGGEGILVALAERRELTGVDEGVQGDGPMVASRKKRTRLLVLAPRAVELTGQEQTVSALLQAVVALERIPEEREDGQGSWFSGRRSSQWKRFAFTFR